jgi:hypothetical protein
MNTIPIAKPAPEDHPADDDCIISTAHNSRAHPYGAEIIGLRKKKSLIIIITFFSPLSPINPLSMDEAAAAAARSIHVNEQQLQNLFFLLLTRSIMVSKNFLTQMFTKMGRNVNRASILP